MNSLRELGIYIHIPFCKSKCYYCDFLSAPSTPDVMQKYVQAVCSELKSYKKIADNRIVKTIYFGGGTPSILPPEFIEEIVCTIKDFFYISADVEMTIECNPGTLDETKAKLYRQYGFNRVSLGLQSTHNTELKSIGRIHTYEEFLECFHILRSCGFNNINVDLMSALPGQTLEAYCKSIERIIALMPEHISSYSLIVEEGTRMHELVRSDIVTLPDEDNEREMYYITGKMLAEAGYERYEISNYAKPGYESRHNSSYWERKNYIGVGVGAASFVDDVRYSNEKDITMYINKINNYKNIRYEEEILSQRDAMEEFIFLGLRMMKGISANQFTNEFGKDIDEVFGVGLNKMYKLKLCERNGDIITLTKKGIDVSNYVFGEIV